VRILFAGTPEVVIPSLNWIASSEHELVGILTRPAAAQGRSSVLIDSPAAEFAKNNSINLYTSIDDLTSENLLSSVDLVIVIAYGQIIPNALLGIPKNGWINVHFSLLPKYRGAAPVQRAIWNGEKISGISIFQLDAGMDTGPLYLQKTVSIDEVQTAGECLEMMSHLVPDLLSETLIKIRNLEKPTPQDNSDSTLAPKINKSEIRAASRAFSFGKYISVKPFFLASATAGKTPLIFRKLPSSDNSPKNIFPFGSKEISSLAVR
jgi:methionyl-tRNA formyltransferase